MALYLAHSKRSISSGCRSSWPEGPLGIGQATPFVEHEAKDTQRRRGVSKVIRPVSEFLTVSDKWLSLGLVLEMGRAA